MQLVCFTNWDFIMEYVAFLLNRWNTTCNKINHNLPAFDNKSVFPKPAAQQDSTRTWALPSLFLHFNPHPSETCSRLNPNSIASSEPCDQSVFSYNLFLILSLSLPPAVSIHCTAHTQHQAWAQANSPLPTTPHTWPCKPGKFLQTHNLHLTSFITLFLLLGCESYS